MIIFQLYFDEICLFYSGEGYVVRISSFLAVILVMVCPRDGIRFSVRLFGSRAAKDATYRALKTMMFGRR